MQLPLLRDERHCVLDTCPLPAIAEAPNSGCCAHLAHAGLNRTRYCTATMTAVLKTDVEFIVLYSVHRVFVCESMTDLRASS